jgi:undecaprenol kinase/diacylglycerol kinase (ATP)
MSRLASSFKFAFKGLKIAWKEQINIRIHFVISILVLVAGVILKISPIEWTVLLICIGLIISLELVNSSIESLVDMVSPEWKREAGKIKDMAAAAVLVASIVATIVGLIIFGSHLFPSYV